MTAPANPKRADSLKREVVAVSSSDPWGLAVRIVAVAVIVGISLWLFVALLQIVLQLVAAIILATGLKPLVGWINQRGVPRGLAVLLIYLALILAIIGLGVAVVPPVLREIDNAVAHAPQYGDSLLLALRDLQAQFPFLPPLDEQVTAQVRNLGSQIGAITSQALQLARLLLGVFSGLLNGILVLLITLYLLVDGHRVREYLLGFVPPPNRARTREITDRMGIRMGGWLLGQVTLSVVVGLVSFVGLTLLGVPGAVLLAVVAAIGEAIPIVGPIAAAVPAVIVALFQAPLLAGLTAILYLLIQQLENNLLVPKIMEKAVNLHPLAVVLSLLAGSELLGIMGAIIAVPVAAATAVLLDELRAAHPTEIILPPEAAGADAEIAKVPTAPSPV